MNELKEELHLHRAVLAVKSSVFLTMFKEECSKEDLCPHIIEEPVQTILFSPTSYISPGLSERFTDETSDVLFVNESKEELRLHRAVRAVNSPVFFTMFEGEWKEKNAKSVPLGEDVNWEAFSIAVNLLYGITTDVTPSCLLEVCKIANISTIWLL